MKINSLPATLAFGLGIFIASPLLAEDSSHGDSAYESAFKAIRNGDVKHLPALLNDSRVLERRDATGTPLLMHAAFYLDATGLKLLLDKCADPNATNKTGASALMWAAADPEKVRLLLRRGANVQAVSSRGNTPLTVAAFQYGAAPVLRQLLDAGADINACNNDGDTALIAAARMGDCEALGVLIEH